MQPRGEEHYIDEAKGDLFSIDGRKDLLSCASTYLDDGNYKASEGIYRGLLSANPNDEDALFGFGLLAQKQSSLMLPLKYFLISLRSTQIIEMHFFKEGGHPSSGKV